MDYRGETNIIINSSLFQDKMMNMKYDVIVDAWLGQIVVGWL